MADASLSGEAAIEVGLDGVTVYMTRRALQVLVSDLNRVLSGDPEECLETHLGLRLAGFADDGTLRWPTVKFSDGLRDIIGPARKASLEAAIASGEIPPEADSAPFEVTIMHVSAEAVAEEAAPTGSPGNRGAAAITLSDVCQFIKLELNTRREVLPDTELYRGLGCAQEDAVDLIDALEIRFGRSIESGAVNAFREISGSDWEDTYRRWRKRPLRPGLTPRYLRRLLEAGRASTSPTP